MLVNLKEILEIADKNNIAIGSFNTPNLASIKAVIKAAEELNQPVIITHAQIHEEMGLCTIEEITPIMLMYANNAKVPVCVHLDHGTDLEYIEKGIKLGYTSVMYDGSILSAEENIKNTQYTVTLAHKHNISVEAEIGSMGSREGSAEQYESIYTEPSAAADFVAKTNVDALACAFGTAHGFYYATPKIDFERLSDIKAHINVPIVMHGGSGVSVEDFKEVIKRGVRKVNYYTYMAKAGAAAISGREYRQFHDALIDAEKAMCEDVKNAIKIFSNL